MPAGPVSSGPAPAYGGAPFGPTVTELAAPRKSRFDWGRLLRLVAVIAPIVIGALVIILIVGTNIGPLAFVIGLATAIIPVPFLVLCFLWLDRYEPEPWKYLAFVFGWGSCVATSVSLGVNTLGSALFEKVGISGAADAVLVAPFIEETTKALGPVLLLILLRRRRRQPISVVDGIVYFGLSATGFAMAENILYLGGIYVMGSENGGAFHGAIQVAVLFVVRIGLSGFAHPLFTTMTGIGFGLAAGTTNKRVRWMAPLAGWIGAMCLHCGWNLMSSLGVQALLVGYAAVMAPIFFAAVGVALWARGYEGRQMARMLQPYVRAGWLTPPELGALSTMNRRMAARRWARRVAGVSGARAMEAYQFALSTLAIARNAQLRGFDTGDFTARERELLGQMSGYRQAFTGRDPSVPPVMWDGSIYHVRFPDGSIRKLPPPDRPVVPIPVALGLPPGYGWRI
ncbi:MAG: PrsW family intramembrane metalloprotease [Actinocatenispora sp.]